MLTKRKKLVSLLFNTGRAMNGHFHLKKEGGVSLLHMETLGYISEITKPSMKDIAGHLRITPASASNLVDGLVEEGFLERFFEEGDRRLIKLSLTQKGEDFLQKGMLCASQKMEEVFGELKEEEIDQFIMLLERVLEITNKKNNQ